jgi:hypothetical protein
MMLHYPETSSGWQQLKLGGLTTHRSKRETLSLS